MREGGTGAREGKMQVAIRQPESSGGERRMLVRFVDDEVASGSSSDLDLERAEFALRFDGSAENTRSAIVPLASVKRILLDRDAVPEALEEDRLRKVALHFWDGEVVTGLLRAVPERHRHGMTVELITPAGDCAEVYAVPYHALKAIFFLRSWDTRPVRQNGDDARHRLAQSRREAPLVELLSEIRGLRGMRHRGQISDVEYERRRSQVLERI